MATYQRVLRRDRPIPLCAMQVRMAYSSAVKLHETLTRLEFCGLWYGLIFHNLKRGTCVADDGRLHGLRNVPCVCGEAPGKRDDHSRSEYSPGRKHAPHLPTRQSRRSLHCTVRGRVQPSRSSGPETKRREHFARSLVRLCVECGGMISAGVLGAAVWFYEVDQRSAAFHLLA